MPREKAGLCDTSAQMNEVFPDKGLAWDEDSFREMA